MTLPLTMNRQTPVKTLPSRNFVYAGGTNEKALVSSINSKHFCSSRLTQLYQHGHIRNTCYQDTC